MCVCVLFAVTVGNEADKPEIKAKFEQLVGAAHAPHKEKEGMLIPAKDTSAIAEAFAAIAAKMAPKGGQKMAV